MSDSYDVQKIAPSTNSSAPLFTLHSKFVCLIIRANSKCTSGKRQGFRLCFRLMNKLGRAEMCPSTPTTAHIFEQVRQSEYPFAR